MSSLTDRAQSRPARIMLRVLIVIAVAVVLLPLLWSIRSALRPMDAYIGDPAGLGGGFTLQNFVRAWSAGLGTGLLNSFLIVPAASVLATAAATLAGWGLAKEPVPFRGFFLVLVAATLALPLTSLAVPLFDQALEIGYLDSRVAVSVVYGALMSGWGTLFLYSYFKNIPRDMIDAAHMDGAGSWRTFASIAFPLSMPAIMSVLVINLFVIWSDMIISLVLLPSSERQTASITLGLFTTHFRAGGPVTAAAMLIAVAPIIAAFVLSQRWLRAEVLGGAVKA